MRPLCLHERRPAKRGVSFRELVAGRAAIEGRTALTLADYAEYAEEICAGGFPAMRHLSGRPRDRQLDSYIERIVDHDLPEAGFNVRRPATVLAWLRAYAAATDTTTSWDKIRDAATSGIDDKPARTTTQPYIELLTALRILDPIPAWIPSNNHLNALIGAPKHHLANPRSRCSAGQNECIPTPHRREPVHIDPPKWNLSRRAVRISRCSVSPHACAELRRPRFPSPNQGRTSRSRLHRRGR
jgi:predicted AAA+ superfamily ATPase